MKKLEKENKIIKKIVGIFIITLMKTKYFFSTARKGKKHYLTNSKPNDSEYKNRINIDSSTNHEMITCVYRSTSFLNIIFTSRSDYDI
jgi:uncharacterized membrane protein